MAKHRAPVDDVPWWEERGSGADRPAVDLRWPVTGKGPSDGLTRVSGSGVVGVARVPVTSRLTPPDRDLRDQGPPPGRVRPTALVTPQGPQHTPPGQHHTPPNPQHTPAGWQHRPPPSRQHGPLGRQHSPVGRGQARIEPEC